MATAAVLPALERRETRLARVFQALSDRTRLEVLERLRHRERCVCELAEAMGIAQPRLSFHLRTLKQAGLVRDRREGRWSHYALVPGAFEEAAVALCALAACAEGSGKCCG